MDAKRILLKAGLFVFLRGPARFLKHRAWNMALQGTDVNNCGQAMATPSKAEIPGGLCPSTAIQSSWTAGPAESTCHVSKDWPLLLALRLSLFSDFQ